MRECARDAGRAFQEGGKVQIAFSLLQIKRRQFCCGHPLLDGEVLEYQLGTLADVQVGKRCF